MNLNIRYAFPLGAIAAALLAAYGTARAAEGEEITALTKPESTISVGAGYVSDDNKRFGQYNGLRKEDPYALVDIDYVRRNDATGTWLKFNGRNLGLDHRELRVEHNRQGDWGYFAEYSQIPRFDPYTVNTRLLGIGGSTQIINGAATPFDLDLKMRRDRLTLGFDKILPRGFDVQVRFRNEEKDGARLFGQGNGFAPIDIRFLTDPINYTTRQLDATLGFTGERLQLSGGYYGTWFDNHNPALNVVNAIIIPGSGPLTPMALPPGNQSHQLYLTGGYNFTPTTRGTFKAAYTRQTQDEAFVVPSMTGRTDLGGKVNTTLLQAGITSRPLPKLSLLANLRYEDRDDRTPMALFFTGAGPTSTLDGFNEPRSIRTTTGKVEASYALPMGFRATGGLDYEEKKRNTFRVRSVSHRDETEEISGRVELRRSMSETVTGAVGYVHSERDGSDFLLTVLNNGTVGSNLIHPLHLADRERNKVRFTVNWQPLEPLSLQVLADYAKDEYSGRTLGPRDGKAQFYSLDAAYTFSEKWQANAWVSRNDIRANQSTCVGASATGVCPATTASPLWDASLRNIGDAVGLGVRGKPYAWLGLGAEVQYSRDKSEFGIQRLSGVPASTPLPDFHFKRTNLKLFADYALQKNSGIRLNYIYERWSTDEWTWTNWVYTDGTRVFQDQVQTVHFVGAQYYYRWR